MSTAHTPASLEGIKRLAKKIRAEKSLQHAAALEEAAKLAGYQTFLHAKRALARRSTGPARARSPIPTARPNPMQYSDFHLRTRASWTNAINRFAPSGDASLTWNDPLKIVEVLLPFMGSNNNHAHLPTGGGFDFDGVEFSAERGCLDFPVRDSFAVTVKPKRLLLERLAADPAESFLLLELDHLGPSGAYDEEKSARIAARRQEDLTDLGGAAYVGLEGNEHGFYYDANGDRFELPHEARNVMRFLGGKIMLVTKGSIWNGLSETYDGIHDRESVANIRDFIEKLVHHRDAA